MDGFAQLVTQVAKRFDRFDPLPDNLSVRVSIAEPQDLCSNQAEFRKNRSSRAQSRLQGNWSQARISAGARSVTPASRLTC